MLNLQNSCHSLNQSDGKIRTIVTWSAAFFHTSIKIVDFHIEVVFILSNVFHCFDFPLISFYFLVLRDLIKIRSKTRTLRALESIQFPDSNFKEDNS